MSDSVIDIYIKNLENRLNYLKDKKKRDYKKYYLDRILTSTIAVIEKLEEIDNKQSNQWEANKKRKTTKPTKFIDEQPKLLGIGEDGKKYNGKTHDKFDRNYNNNPGTKSFKKGKYEKDSDDSYLSDESYIVDDDEEEFESGSESESEIGSESGSESDYGGKKNKKTLKNIKTKRSAKSRKTVRKRNIKKGKKNIVHSKRTK